MSPTLIASRPNSFSTASRAMGGLGGHGAEFLAGAANEFLASANIQSRSYQQRIIHTAIQMFSGCWVSREGHPTQASRSVLIESPTGSGKTVMGLAVASLIQRLTGCRVGWVAMRRNLLVQAQKENQRRGFGLQMSLISMFDKTPPKVDLLVVDEAQHDAATSMANLHCQIQPAMTLGLSATPYRCDKIKLCFDQVIRDAGIAQLIADGYLSNYHHYSIPKYSPSSVAELLIREPQRWGQSLVFFHRNEQCYQCQTLLHSAGVRCDVVTASTNRQRQLSQFEAGEIDVLINMAVLTEGFDCPTLKTVFCRPSGKGCTIQMAGRVLRKCPEVPIKQVVQCLETRHPMLKTAMAAEQYILTPDGWRSISANRRLDEITAKARQIIAQSSTQLPKLVTAHRSRPLTWIRGNVEGI